MPSTTAVRKDTSGYVEEASYVSAGGDDIFCVVYCPDGPPRAGVIICPSLFAEQMKLYRSEVLAARAFAASGFAVARFHYRGTSHSEGNSLDATVATMIEDGMRMTELLRERFGIQSLSFCGARWGGLIAGSMASRGSGDGLVLWEPVFDGETFFRESFRSAQMSALAHGTRRRPTPWVDEIEERGFVDLLGYPLGRALFASARERTLQDVAGGGSRSILLIQIKGRANLEPEYARWADALTAGGSVVNTICIDRDEAWSFVGAPLSSTRALIDNTLNWLCRTYPI